MSGKHYTLSGEVSTLNNSFIDLSGKHYTLSSEVSTLNSNFTDLSGKHYTLSGEVSTNLNTLNDLSSNYYTFKGRSDASFSQIGETTGGAGITFLNDVSFNGFIKANDASFARIGALDGSLVVVGDLSVNGNIYSSGGLVGSGGEGGGGSGTDGTIENIILFDASNATSNTNPTSFTPWELNRSVALSAGSVIFHNIKVSAYIAPGYVNWPLGGHEFRLQRKTASNVSYTWNSTVSFENFKHHFDTQNDHEEVVYSITEKITTATDYTYWKCDLSGDGARNNNLDKLTWGLTILTPGEYVTPGFADNNLDVKRLNVGEGNTGPTVELDVSGDAKISGSIIGDLSVNGNISSTGNIVSSGINTTNLSINTLTVDAQIKKSTLYITNVSGSGSGANQYLLNNNGYFRYYKQPRFSAYSINSNANYTGYNRVVLEKTFYNVGSHYNTSGTNAGIFTAPVTGEYSFTLTIYNNSGSVRQYALWYKPTYDPWTDATPNKLQSMGNAGDDIILSVNHGMASSATFLIRLNANTQIAFGGRNGGQHIIYRGHSFFSGELLNFI